MRLHFQVCWHDYDKDTLELLICLYNILVNGSQVIEPNILTQTGVIHVIDQGRLLGQLATKMTQRV